MCTKNDKIIESVVLIGDASGTKFGTGFAFYTENNLVWLLTCAHNVRNVGDSRELYILDPRFKSSSVEIVACGQEDQADLAVLKAQLRQDKSIPILQMQLDGVKRDTDYEIMGFSSLNKDKKLRRIEPLEAKLEKSAILIQQIPEAPLITAWKLQMEPENDLEEGYSGSPVYGKRDRIVIAVATLQILKGQKGYAISLENLPEIFRNNLETLPQKMLPLIFPPEVSESSSEPAYLQEPYRPIPIRHFMGRKSILHNLEVSLKHGAFSLFPQAITGLGGIGKTQLAVQYALLHSSDYAGVWWFQAETPTTLCRSFLKFANKLHLYLPEGNKEETLMLEAVLDWLGAASQRWLLIYDNASNPKELTRYLPQPGFHHVLITSINPNWDGVAELHDLEPLSREESREYLLKLTKTSNIVAAEELADALGDLPLALEQAAAYIVETKSDLSGYLELYKNQGAKLRKLGSMITSQHPAVATTWNLSFRHVEKTNQSAAELLRFCAFLQPDAIPEGLIVDGASQLGPILAPVAADPYEFNMAIADARKYSLLHRDPDTKTLKIHRLVQDVLKDDMDEETKKLWLNRVERAWYQVVPSSEHFPAWLFPSDSQRLNIQELLEMWGKLCPLEFEKYKEDGYLHSRHRKNVLKLLTLYGTVSFLNETIVQSTNRNDLFHGICRDAVKHGPFIMAWIGLLDDKARSIVSYCQYSHEAGDLPSICISVDELAQGKDPTGIAIQNGEVASEIDYFKKKGALSWLEESLRCRVHSCSAMPVLFGGKTIGVITLYVDQPNFFSRHQVQFLEAMKNDISSALDGFQQSARSNPAQTALQEMLQQLERDIEKIEGDCQMSSHQHSVSELAVMIGRNMGLNKTQIDGIHFAGLIHDIGNISIPSAILSKSGQLSDLERAIIHSHVQEGCDIVKDIDCPWPVGRIIMQHHEHLDGSGYPMRLREKDILLEAQILAIADRLIASLCRRPNRSPLDIDDALNTIKRYRGVRFNSDGVDACLSEFADNRLSTGQKPF